MPTDLILQIYAEYNNVGEKLGRNSDEYKHAMEIWKQSERIIYENYPTQVVLVQDDFSVNLDKMAINALAKRGPLLNDASDWVICSCCRMVRKQDHYSWGRHTWCTFCEKDDFPAEPTTGWSDDEPVNETKKLVETSTTEIKSHEPDKPRVRSNGRGENVTITISTGNRRRGKQGRRSTA